MGRMGRMNWCFSNYTCPWLCQDSGESLPCGHLPGQVPCPSSAMWLLQERLHWAVLMQLCLKPMCERWNNGAFPFWRFSKNPKLSKASLWSWIDGETKGANMLKIGAVFCVGSLNIHIKTMPPRFLMWEMFEVDVKAFSGGRGLSQE